MTSTTTSAMVPVFDFTAGFSGIAAVGAVVGAGTAGTGCSVVGLGAGWTTAVAPFSAIAKKLKPGSVALNVTPVSVSVNARVGSAVHSVPTSRLSATSSRVAPCSTSQAFGMVNVISAAERSLLSIPDALISM